MRLDSLGEDFSEQNLRKVVAGERPLPRFYKPKNKQADDGRIALLVDLQKKILEGKGAGYYRWASGFNLKQSVKTYNWLSEHKMTYEELAERSREVTDQYHQLAGKINKDEGAHDGSGSPADAYPQLHQDPRHLCGLSESRVLQEVSGGA